MIVVKFIPGSLEAGGTKIYHAAAVSIDTGKGELALKFRDGGALGMQILGPWTVEITEEFGIRPHTTDEAERIHNGSALVMVN